jgi:2-succinyl-6-hydroxy-2,4-cyclohexadiene-1-carboxylate synthase
MTIKIHRQMAHLGNINLFYRDTRTEGPVILCLHGRFGRGETWVDFMYRFGDRNRVIAPDQRGHGLSDKPVSTYTVDEMAADMVSLLEYLHIPSVILVGHSMGGYIGGYLAAEYPQVIKRLAILDKSANGPEKASPLTLDEVGTADPVTGNWPMPFSSLVEAQEFLKKETESELSYQYFMNSLVEDVDGYRMMFSSQALAANIAYYENWYHLLPRINCPVLLMRASGGEAVPDEDFVRMRTLLRRCMVREVMNPDHNIHQGNKEEFYGYMDEFLAWLK